MKQLIIILSLIFAIYHKNAKAQDDNGLYSRRYERLDIDTILASPRLVTNYVDCLLNKKPCPPEGKALKRILPEALRTKCGKCWPNQKEGALKVITVLYNDYPKHYNALRDKWDPTGEYHRRFEEYIGDQRFNSIGSNNNNNNSYQDNDDINQGQQTQVTTTIVANSNRKSSVQPTSSNSNRISSDKSSSRNSNRISSNPNHSSNLHRIPSDQSSRNLQKTPPVKSHAQNSERKPQTKSSPQNSNKIPSTENHRPNSNRISQNQTPERHSNRIQSIERSATSSTRLASVQIPNSNRMQPSQTAAHNSNRSPSIHSSPPNSNRISQIRTQSPNTNRVQTPVHNSNNLQSIHNPSTNSNRFLSVQTPLFDFNLIPSIETPSPNFNRLPLTTSPPPSNRFNFNIIPSIQTSLNLNANRIPFIQSPPYFDTPSLPVLYHPPNPIQNNNLNHIDGNSRRPTSTNQISFRFANDERSSQNDISFPQRSTVNIPKPTKHSTNKIRSSTTTKLPKTRISTISVTTTKTPNFRRSNITQNHHIASQNNVITERPTRQGIKRTTTVQAIIRLPTYIPSSTLRPSTISTTTKRSTTFTTRPSTMRAPTIRTTTTTTELPEINSPNDIFNRFGDSDDENVVSSPTTTITTNTRKPARPLLNQQPIQRPQPAVSPQYLPGFVTTTTFQSNNNILNIINRLTTKLSNTADFVAGVLRVPQAIIEKSRTRHHVIWQNLAKTLPPPNQPTLTFRLF